tara:strand:+ start:307 stop:822 length:516 start_codon:yes stop_codon:yes gene_type:complete
MSVTNPEKLKFIHRIVGDTTHTGRKFFDHLLNTSILVEEICDYARIRDSRYLIDSALYHSIYGTDYFQFQSEVTREKVIELIGEKAEQLVKFFCDLDDRSLQICQHKFSPATLQRDLYILEYANIVEISISDVEKTGALNPSKIFRMKLIRANLIHHYNLDIPPLPFNFPS